MIAVIGISGRFPRSSTPETLWGHLAAGRELVSFFTEEETRAAGVPDLVRRLPEYVNARAIIEDPECFDARFFDVSPAEAGLTDPQHRIFLECAWEVFENAGYDPSRIEAPVGVYAGADVSSYAAGNLPLWTHDLSSLIGNDKDYLATRVAFKLNLRGPAVSIQTACSTSLVATHMAARALLDFQCDYALAGGVGIAFPQRAGYVFQQGSILSPDGHCRAFDAEAQGTVGGDGCGVILLKRLDDALADGDFIHAVILGSAVNNDGAKKMAFSAPSVEGQAECIALAHAVANVPVESIEYIEAHGTGTALGDPVEIAALTDVFRSHTQRRGFCAIGSIKTNLGHMNTAAGIGGLIKAILALEHQQIPPSLFFKSSNPQIDFSRSPFFVNRTLKPWPRTDHPRRAGVSSFGVGGTNSHVVIEEAPARHTAPSRRQAHVLVVSARSDEALTGRAQDLARHLTDHPEQELADVAFTLLEGRKRLERRAFIVASSHGEAAEKLMRVGPSLRGGEEGSLVLMFPGQGSQMPRMARGLYQAEPRFRLVFDRIADLAEPELRVDLRKLLLGDEPWLNRTDVVQPALFAVQVALVSVLVELGVKPSVLIGHSVGEFAAATIAGVMSIEDALSFLILRGTLLERLPEGAMLAVGLPEGEAEQIEGLSVAAVNAHDVTVVSGSNDACLAAEEALKKRRVSTTRLPATRAFHSSMMAPAVEPLHRHASTMQLAAPTIAIFSTVTGTQLTETQARDPMYWASQVRRPVRFAQALAASVSSARAVCVDVGPGRTLSALARRQGIKHPISAMRSPQDDADDEVVFLEAVASMWAAGTSLDARALYPGEARRRVPLPTYPFQRERYVHTTSIDWGPTTSEPTSSTVGLYEPAWHRLPSRNASLAAPRCVLVATDPRAVDSVRHALPHVAVVPDLAALQAAFSESYAAAVIIWDGFSSLTASAAVSRLFDVARVIRPPVSDARVRLVLVLPGSADVLGASPISPIAMAVVAAARVLAQELPHIQCVTLDLSHAAPDAIAGALLQTSFPHEAVCGAARFTERLLPISPEDGDDPFHAGDVIVIPGGLGHVGLMLAEHLAQTRKVHLVLTSRVGLPPTSEWARWPETHREDDPVSERIRRIRAIEATGCKVLVISADLCDRERLALAFKRAAQVLGPVTAVVHAAGVSGREAFVPAMDTTRSNIDAFFRAKEEGLGVLLDVMPTTVRLCVLTSSLSAPIGGVGLAAYAGANAYMDGVASTSHPNARILAIDWDAIQAPHANAPASAALTVEEVGRAFSAAVRSGARRVVVIKGDVERRLRAATARAQHAPKPAAPAAKHARPDTGVEYLAPRNETEAELASIWSDILAIDPVGVRDNFFKLGGDSLQAIQMTARIRASLGAELLVSELFEEPTIESVAVTVERKRSSAAAARAETAQTVAMVERLSDEEVSAMLANMANETQGIDERRFAFDTGGSLTDKDEVRSFYDAVSAQLDASEFADFALFLNYGYVPNDAPSLATTAPDHTLNKNAIRLVLELVGDYRLTREQRLLDVGCGRGGTISVLRKHYVVGPITGLDLSPVAIKFCQRHHALEAVSFMVGDAQRLPFKEDSFDVVTNVESSHAYAAPNTFFVEVARVLCPRGVLLYTDIVPAHEVSEREDFLASQGLEMVQRRDITGNVLLSCDETAASHARAFRGPNSQALMDRFLGVRGTALYEGMKNGSQRYLIYRFQKRSSSDGQRYASSRGTS